ncbi:MAG: PilZ domain-containing protein [Cyanobacteriota bacterium]|nr:PilZ domain-containing protein [Cyanobacteriota bacterium]
MEPEDLVAFRVALRDLDSVVPVIDRRRESRFTPTGPLSRARVTLPQVAGELEADVVDLSAHGMRLAVRADVACAEGDHCQIRIDLSPTRQIRLSGEVRWSTHHRHITVFGVLLDATNQPLRPV